MLKKTNETERGIHMAKATYRPKNKEQENQEPVHNEPEVMDLQSDETMDYYYEEDESKKVDDVPRISVVGNRKNQHKLDSTKIVGDLDCEYHVYIEDYVYTYLYQLAAVDLSKESSALLIGEVYNDSKEAIVRAAIPIDMDKLEEGAEWIDMGVAEEIEEMRKVYFPNLDIIGWMHMQPGYGTMLTMKELREHQSVFEGNGTLCILIDAINKIETVFVYEDDELKEQSGYCMFYERNEEMQRFMLDHPFVTVPKEEMKDAVVSQFREIGKARKAEYKQRRTLNLTVMAASVILIALTAVIVKMNENDTFIDTLKTTTKPQNVADATGQNSLNENLDLGLPVGEDFTTNPEDTTNITPDTTSDTTLDDAITPNLDLDEGVVPETGEDQPTSANVDSSVLGDNTEVTPNDNEIADKEENKVEEEIKPEETASSTEEYDTYVVKSGDTLADICYREYGDAKRSLEVAKLNGLSSTNQIVVGQELKMPK